MRCEYFLNRLWAETTAEVCLVPKHRFDSPFTDNTALHFGFLLECTLVMDKDAVLFLTLS